MSQDKASFMTAFHMFLGHSGRGDTAVQAFNPPSNKYIKNANDIIEFVKKHEDKKQLYISVNPAKTGLKDSYFFKEVDVDTVVNIFIDCDAKKEDPNIENIKKYAATENEYKAVLPAIDIIKTWLTDRGFKVGYYDKTGNGCRFILPIPPVDVSDHDKRGKWKEQVKELYREIERDTGLELDKSVFDTRRITGIPGTLNRKLETETRKNRIREPGEVPERVEDEKLLKHIEGFEVEWEPEKTTDEPKPAATVTTKFNEESMKKLSSLFNKDVKLKRLYSDELATYNDEYGYPSRSEAEQALYNKLVFYGFSDDEIDNILSKAKIGKWETAKPSYKERTKIKAHLIYAELGEQPAGAETPKNKTKDKPKTIDEKYPKDILETANEILNNGDALEFILDVWARRHVGDRAIGESCAAAVAATTIRNTAGLHLKPSGGSGKGKSAALKAYINLLPDDMKIEGSLSSKAAFYDDDLKKGTIIFSDDANLNDSIIDTIKRSTTNYQQFTWHNTVTKNLTIAKRRIPERISWWLTTVDSFDDEQAANRFICADVDDSKEQDKAVFDRQVELELQGVTNNTVDECVLICRAIYDILRLDEYEIMVPFVKAISWENKDNRRNFPMFLDIVKSVTLYSIRRRECFNGLFLSNVDDFKRAKEIYNKLAETNQTNLSKIELMIMDLLTGKVKDDKDTLLENGGKERPDEVKREEGYNIKRISKHIKKAETTARYYMKGRDGKGGLLSKIAGINQVKTTDSEYDKDTGIGHYAPKDMYIYSNSTYGLASYDDVVTIDKSKVDECITDFKQKYENPFTTVTTDLLQTYDSDVVNGIRDETTLNIYKKYIYYNNQDSFNSVIDEGVNKGVTKNKSHSDGVNQKNVVSVVNESSDSKTKVVSGVVRCSKCSKWDLSDLNDKYAGDDMAKLLDIILTDLEKQNGNNGNIKNIRDINLCCADLVVRNAELQNYQGQTKDLLQMIAEHDNNGGVPA